VLGREVRDELARIARGERTPDDEVRRQWNSLLEQTRSRWRTVRRHVKHRRSGDGPRGR
jgi:membrane protein